MRALVQRVTSASVDIGGERVASISQGLLLLLGVDKQDDRERAARLAEKVLDYRVFSDTEGKMNLSLRSQGFDLLVVSQFTLAANTKKGLRPSFSEAAPPQMAEELYEYFLDCCRGQVGNLQTGQFAADMQVALVNDGPVTFLLEV